jgi:hypothetical protein
MACVVKLSHPMLKTEGWPQGATDVAVAAVNSKSMGYLRAAKNHRVRCDAPERYVEQCTGGEVNALRKKPAFLTEIETDLVNHCLQVEQRSVGFSCSGKRQITFQLEEENGIPHPSLRNMEEPERNN